MTQRRGWHSGHRDSPVTGPGGHTWAGADSDHDGRGCLWGKGQALQDEEEVTEPCVQGWAEAGELATSPLHLGKPPGGPLCLRSGAAWGAENGGLAGRGVLRG